MGSKKKSVGFQLAALLDERKLTPKQAAEKAGVDARELKAYLDEKKLPPVAVMLRIARALSVEPNSLIAAGEVEKKNAPESIARRKNNYNYKMLSQTASGFGLRAFEVSVPANAEHEKIGYRHAGEEFIYVLAGSLDITVGRKTHHLEKGMSIHFDSAKPHLLSNPGARANKLLVVLSSPEQQ